MRFSEAKLLEAPKDSQSNIYFLHSCDNLCLFSKKKGGDSLCHFPSLGQQHRQMVSQSVPLHIPHLAKS